MFLMNQPRFEVVPKNATIPSNGQLTVKVALKRMDIDFDDETIPNTTNLNAPLLLDFNNPLLGNRTILLSATFKKINPTLDIQPLIDFGHHLRAKQIMKSIVFDNPSRRKLKWKLVTDTSMDDIFMVESKEVDLKVFSQTRIYILGLWRTKETCRDPSLFPSLYWYAVHLGLPYRNRLWNISGSTRRVRRRCALRC